MKTVFVGGGQGCQAVLELILQQRLATLSLEILGVVDISSDAPAMGLAREQGWSTFDNLDAALALPQLELVIELTGRDEVRDEIYHKVPHHVRVMDHSLARVFWDLDEAVQDLREQLAEKTRLEAEIRADRHRLQEILDSLPDAVMVVDPAQRIERVNQRFERVSGVGAAQILGHLCSEAVCNLESGKDCPSNLCPRQAVLNTGRAVTVVEQDSCLGWGKGDREAYYEVTANPIHDEEGQVSVVVTSREVTDQILLKRETEESARRFDQILSAVHGAITIKDLKGRYQLANPSAERLFKIPQQRFVGRTAEKLFPPDVAQIIVGNDRTVTKARRHVSHEETLVIDGEELVLVSERLLLVDYRDAPVALCCVSRDVTEARRLQHELVQSEKHAAVGKLAAGVAHEINNPLTGILTFAEDLLDSAEPEDPTRPDLEVIMRETLRCRRIVRDLLDYSRQTAPSKQNTPVPPIIDKALDLVRKQAAFHDIELRTELAPERLSVEVDPNQLQQVVLNLVINARDAMNGKGTIFIRTIERPEAGHVVIEVADQGGGVPPENMGRIFEPFFSTKGQQGNGLGLAVVRSIVEQSGGRIDLDNRVGEGATFRITLPAGRAAQQRRPRG